MFPTLSVRHVLAFAPALLLFPGPAATFAQAPETVDPADVASMDAVVAAVYDAISGPAGQERDWARFRGLFADGARLISVGRGPDGETALRTVTPEQYIERSAPIFAERGFFEREIGQTTDRFGPIAHRFSAYETREREADAEPMMRGINSFQLLHDGERWWIVTVYWTNEGTDLPLPERYIGGR